MRQLYGRGGWWATLSAVMALAQLRNASLCEGSRVAYAAKVFVPTLAAHALPAGMIRLRGGYGAGPGAFSDESRGVVEEDEFFRKFGSGPGGMDLSGSRFEVRPDSFNDTESLMDGIGLWDYPEEQRLVGEHHTPRVGYRVRTSLHLRVVCFVPVWCACIVVRVRARVRLHHSNVLPPPKHTQHTYILVYSFAVYFREGFVQVG